MVRAYVYLGLKFRLTFGLDKVPYGPVGLFFEKYVFFVLDDFSKLIHCIDQKKMIHCTHLKVVLT